MQNIYGFIANWSGEFIEIGLTEKGAKISATRFNELNGYEVLTVGYRSPINNMFIPTSQKENGKWEQINA